MTKRGVIRMVLSVLLMIYIGCALYFTSQMEAADRYRGFEVSIAPTRQQGFVTASDIDAELSMLSARISTMARDSVNTLAIERQIKALDNIETANCVILNNGVVRLDVVPLIPVARVFDANGSAYYINHAGKRMEANPRYRVDVPVVTGRFNTRLEPTVIVPVLDYIADKPELSALASQFKVAANGDILLVPMVAGHVVNLGDTADLANKFARLKVFYRDVMPVKGWETYDTISVKWRGQVVAHKHVSRPRNDFIPVDDDNIDDPETMNIAAPST